MTEKLVTERAPNELGDSERAEVGVGKVRPLRAPTPDLRGGAVADLSVFGFTAIHRQGGRAVG
jgi:hypothetical protein